MKILILYRPDSDHASMVEDYVRDFQREHDVGNKLELMNVDTRDGSATAELYDVMSYPAILALADNGSLINLWQGQLPLMDEIVGYIYS